MADKYGTDPDTQYCYPNSDVLINKLGLTDEVALEYAEIELTQARIEQFDPDFDNISLAALLGIHRYLFQDLYDWAGELREVDIRKGATRFANMTRIEPEAHKLFQQLAKEDYLVGLPFVFGVICIGSFRAHRRARDLPNNRVAVDVSCRRGAECCQARPCDLSMRPHNRGQGVASKYGMYPLTLRPWRRRALSRQLISARPR